MSKKVWRNVADNKSPLEVLALQLGNSQLLELALELDAPLLMLCADHAFLTSADVVQREKPVLRCISSLWLQFQAFLIRHNGLLHKVPSALMQ